MPVKITNAVIPVYIKITSLDEIRSEKVRCVEGSAILELPNRFFMDVNFMARRKDHGYLKSCLKRKVRGYGNLCIQESDTPWITVEYQLAIDVLRLFSRLRKHEPVDILLFDKKPKRVHDK